MILALSSKKVEKLHIFSNIYEFVEMKIMYQNLKCSI